MNMMKPFFLVALLILAATMATMATLTPAVHAGDDNKDTDIDIKGGLWWYIRYGRNGDRCHNTLWGEQVCRDKDKNLNCCKHKCVDLRWHEYHCGSCGARCPFPKQCCGGKCVNLDLDPYNCGKCSNKCPKGKCHHGLCNYAK